jgi:cell division protein FtsB
VTWARIARWLAVVGVVWFAVQGGEYSSYDLLAQRTGRRRLMAQIDSLKAQLDSLDRYRRALLTDPELQERMAREEFGMVRGDKEILYRFSAPKSAAR